MLDELVHCQIFTGMSAPDLELLSQIAAPRAYAEGEVIIAQAKPATTLYLITSGEVGLRYKPYDGPELTLTRIHSCSVLGWSAVLGNKMYTSSGVCHTRVTALAIHTRDLRWLIREHPATGQHILERLAKSVSSRWKDAEEQVKDMLRKERGLSADT